MKARYLDIAFELERSIPRLISEGITSFPSEAELCARFGCSRQTIRSALQCLQEKKLIIKYKGSGTYIASGSAKGKIALILPFPSEYIYHSMQKTAKRFFRELNLELICFESKGLALTERAILKGLLENPPAGIILFPAGASQTGVNCDILTQLSENGTAIVSLFESAYLPPEAVSVCADIENGSRDMALKLLSAGKNMHFKAVLAAGSPSALGQFKGLMEAAVDSGGRFCERDIISLSADELEDMQSGSYETLNRLIRLCISKNTVLFCGSDEIAYHFIKQLQKNGFRIPGEVLVSGFDNSYFCTMSSPAITSVGTESDALIKAACRSLLQLITGRQAPSLRLPMYIYGRRSTESK